VVSGLDPSRAALVLAVLERAAGLATHGMDAYFKVTGGLSVDDPAIDLGLACAAASSITGRPLDPQWVVLGEVGLTGDLRRVPRMAERLAEAEALGFSRALVPGKTAEIRKGLTVYPAASLPQALARLGLEPGRNQE